MATKRPSKKPAHVQAVKSVARKASEKAANRKSKVVVNVPSDAPPVSESYAAIAGVPVHVASVVVISQVPDGYLGQLWRWVRKRLKA